MEKANVIKALEICDDNGFCGDCPYYGVDSCKTKMLTDAASMLKANKAPKTTRYPLVYIYTKKGNLLPYFDGKAMCVGRSQEQVQNLRKYYAKEREIQLIAMFRYEGNRVFCKIKCPVNPIPTKGEFEIPSIGALVGFLAQDGWFYKQTINPRMFE